MSFKIIENKGPDNLRDTLKFYLRQSSEVSIAVAFITQQGLEEIIQKLRQVAVKGKVRVLTGLYQNVTEPRALEMLNRIEKETGGRFSCRLSREPQFHRKLYLLQNKTRSIYFIGSSNLTQNGLCSGGELNLMASQSENSLDFKRFKRVFDDDWKHRAVSLTAEQIVKYKKVRPSNLVFVNYTGEQLKNILGKKILHQHAVANVKTGVYWRDGISGFVKNKTEKIIEEKTNWDEKGYEWYTPGRFHSYKIGDKIFLFDFKSKRISLVNVEDIAETEITPDGKHFVAFKETKRLSRRFSKGLWEDLEDEGVTKKRATDRKEVGDKKAKKLESILRRRN